MSRADEFADGAVQIKHSTGRGGKGILYAHVGGQRAGELAYGPHVSGLGIEVRAVRVEQDFQRHGIATRLYDEAHRRLGGQPFVHDRGGMTADSRGVVSKRAQAHPDQHFKYNLRTGGLDPWA